LTGISLMAQRLRKFLVEHMDRWVSLPEVIMLPVSCHRKRFHELRTAGMIILCRRSRVGRRWVSQYRCVKDLGGGRVVTGFQGSGLVVGAKCPNCGAVLE